MANYEYILSSLPFLTPEWKYGAGEDFSSVVRWIREGLPKKDAAALDFFLKGFDPAVLGEDFYAQALSHGVPFIRDYFCFDLQVRNAKVRYLNRQLERPAEQDVVNGEPKEFPQAAHVESVLQRTDLLEREKGLDDLYWQQADTLALFHYFDLTAVLAYIAKLHIVDRWITLDEEHGRQLFRQLTDEVRGTFKGVSYNEQ